MSANIRPIQVPPPHGIPDSAIDALFGRGLDRAGWRTELERNNYTWVPDLKNRIIKREIWFFKAEIGRLLSAPNTNPGRKSKSNSRKSVLKQMKGKNGDGATRSSNRTLFSPDAKLRTFEHYVKKWQGEDPSYGVPARSRASPTVTNTGGRNPNLSDCQAASSCQSVLSMTTDHDRNASGEALSRVQAQLVEHSAVFDASHDFGPSFNPSTPSSTVFDHRTAGDSCPPTFVGLSLGPTSIQCPSLAGEYSQERPDFGGLTSSHSNTTQCGYYASTFEVPSWDAVDALMTANSMSGYALSDPDLNEIYETSAAVAFEQSPVKQISPQRIVISPGTNMYLPAVQNDRQEGPDEINLRAALAFELSSATPSTSAQQHLQNVAVDHRNIVTLPSRGRKSRHDDPYSSNAACLRCDTEMFDVNYSHFSDDNATDEDVPGQRSQTQHRVSRQPELAGMEKGFRAKVIKSARKELRCSNSALRETRLRQQVIRLKSQSRASNKELEEKNASILKKDTEILDLAKRVKLLEILGKRSSQQYDDLPITSPNESSPMDDIIYQNIVHQRRNDKIIQEAKAAKERTVAQKETSERSFSGTATDDEKESASRRGIASPSRRISRIVPSKGAISLGLRFTSSSNKICAQRPESANSNGAEKTSETSTPPQSPIRRAGLFARQVNDTLLGKHRESIPPAPILRQWKEVHDDIQKRYTGDSGYESIDLRNSRSSMAGPNDQHDRDESFHENYI